MDVIVFTVSCFKIKELLSELLMGSLYFALHCILIQHESKREDLLPPSHIRVLRLRMLRISGNAIQTTKEIPVIWFPNVHGLYKEDSY